MGVHELAQNERRTIAHQFHQVESDVDEWVRLASSVLANALHSAAVGTLPVSSHARLRRLELVPLGERLVLLALLLASGALRKQLLHTEEPVDRDGLVRLSNRSTAALANASASRVGRESARTS